MNRVALSLQELTPLRFSVKCDCFFSRESIKRAMLKLLELAKPKSKLKSMPNSALTKRNDKVVRNCVKQSTLKQLALCHSTPGVKQILE